MVAACGVYLICGLLTGVVMNGDVAVIMRQGGVAGGGGDTPLAHNNCDSLKYVTYTKRNPETGEVYTGRTSGRGDPLDIVAQRDARHHMNRKGFEEAQIDKVTVAKKSRVGRQNDPAYQAIRGREQQMIDAHGGAKSAGGTSGNAIRGISPKNPRRKKYLDAANKHLG